MQLRGELRGLALRMRASSEPMVRIRTGISKRSNLRKMPTRCWSLTRLDTTRSNFKALSLEAKIKFQGPGAAEDREQGHLDAPDRKLR